MKETAYTLIRSDRKTLAIRVLTDGSVEIRAPRRLSKEKIEQFLAEKRNWIESHRKVMLERFPDELDARKILYKGNWKTIKPLEEDRLFFDGEFFYAPADWDENTLKTALAELMKKLAKKEMLPMVQSMAAEMGVSPAKISVTAAKTKWGSCSGAKNINLSWRLLAAPVDAIAYVICHELCHMTEMNHGPRFWALVEKQIPDWRRKRERLAEVQSWLDAYYR